MYISNHMTDSCLRTANSEQQKIRINFLANFSIIVYISKRKLSFQSHDLSTLSTVYHTNAAIYFSFSLSICRLLHKHYSHTVRFIGWNLFLTTVRNLTMTLNMFDGFLSFRTHYGITINSLDQSKLHLMRALIN